MDICEQSDGLELAEVINYIASIKARSPGTSVVDILVNYCFERGISEDYLGSLISEYMWFKDIISSEVNPQQSSDW